MSLNVKSEVLFKTVLRNEELCPIAINIFSVIECLKQNDLL